MEDLEPYRHALKARVCAICLDRRDDGACGLPESRVCALDLHLPRIVQAVEAVQSRKIDDYAASIRSVVCSDCVNQDEKGYCHFRSNWDCALDTFAYLVVEGIEEVKQAQQIAPQGLV